MIRNHVKESLDVYHSSNLTTNQIVEVNNKLGTVISKENIFFTPDLAKLIKTFKTTLDNAFQIKFHFQTLREEDANSEKIDMFGQKYLDISNQLKNLQEEIENLIRSELRGYQ